VTFLLDQSRRVPALEEAAATCVALVEALRVRAVEEVHSRRQLGASALEEEVIVRAHLGAGDTAPSMPDGGDVHEAVELDAVDVVAVEKLRARSSSRDVIEAVRQLAAGHARHRSRR
jgi:hypothetical protein